MARRKLTLHKNIKLKPRATSIWHSFANVHILKLTCSCPLTNESVASKLLREAQYHERSCALPDITVVKNSTSNFDSKTIASIKLMNSVLLMNIKTFNVLYDGE